MQWTVASCQYSAYSLRHLTSGVSHQNYVRLEDKNILCVDVPPSQESSPSLHTHTYVHTYVGLL